MHLDATDWSFVAAGSIVLLAVAALVVYRTRSASRRRADPPALTTPAGSVHHRHVFISYSRDDLPYVRRLVARTRSKGIDVWFDEQIPNGARWDSLLREKIDTCAAFVVVMSVSAQESRWVAEELRHADHLKKPILPLLLSGEPFFGFGLIQFDDVRNQELPPESFFGRLRAYVGMPRPPHAIETQILRFCQQWRPTRVAESDELAALESDYVKTFGVDHAVGQAYLQMLVAAHPTGIASHDVAAKLAAVTGSPVDDARLEQFRSDLTRDLHRLPSNLLQYQVYVVTPSATDNHVAAGDVHVLRPVSVFALMNRARAAANTNPVLREGWSLYDRGDYMESAQLLAGLLPKLDGPQRMTVGELTVLFYYLAKALLKLNWYDLLNHVLEGPYKLFSDRVVGGDLEAERLQIHAISLRQRGRPSDAAACLREAVRLLKHATNEIGHPSIDLAIADVYVLLVQTTLDEILDPDGFGPGRRARLREAEDLLREARVNYERWWSRDPSNEPVHYEGRLNGTSAFVTVARSLVEPDTITHEDWTRGERFARMGYEPERYRKPFGIVAGRYAHAMVLLAKAAWLEHQAGDGDARTSERLIALHEGRRLLQSAKRDFLDTGAVALGGEYEEPKFYKAIDLYDAMLSADPPAGSLLETRGAQLLTPLV